MKHRARRPPRSPAILAARGSARERLLPFCAAGDRTYAFPTPLDRGVPVAPLMGAPARLTGPCRPAWDGKLELCDGGGGDGWEALFGEAAAGAAVAAVRRRVSRALGWVPRR